MTSPPFLDVVQYAQDNWLRCWFNGVDAKLIQNKITMSKTVESWSEVMSEVFENFIVLQSRSVGLRLKWAKLNTVN